MWQNRYVQNNWHIQVYNGFVYFARLPYVLAESAPTVLEQTVEPYGPHGALMSPGFLIPNMHWIKTGAHLACICCCQTPFMSYFYCMPLITLYRCLIFDIWYTVPVCAAKEHILQNQICDVLCEPTCLTVPIYKTRSRIYPYS